VCSFRSFITYTYISKREMLGVKPRTLATHGAVSEQVVREMVEGALARSHAQVALSISGVAGPGGGTPDKPVGLVWLGFALPDRVLTEKMDFPGDRAAVRAATVQHALRRLVELTA
jgi:nicotinamide-nucleotide amidase